jgi:hypothetical protein
MTEPRPRLTNTMGSVQQTSVVTDDVMLMMPETRSRIQRLYCLGARSGLQRNVGSMLLG